MQKTEIRTRRMTLHPMADAEIENLIARTDSDALRAAYGEMLDGCRRDPEKRIWYAPWAMALHENQAYIGDIDFKGLAQNHAVEIGYGVLPEYEGNGYTAEALRAMAKWAFEQPDVACVEAETAPDNAAFQRVHAKCGFVPHGMGAEGSRFVLRDAVID